MPCLIKKALIFLAAFGFDWKIPVQKSIANEELKLLDYFDYIEINSVVAAILVDFFPTNLLIKKSLGFKMFESNTAHLLFQNIYLCNRK